MATRPTDSEINDELANADEWVSHGETAVPGMSFEEGVSYALRWVLGEETERPIEEQYGA